tara:strand:- start:515 stop:709 length:195 start_codon:yes stop_codon:yes gene_type:complete
MSTDLVTVIITLLAEHWAETLLLLVLAPAGLIGLILGLVHPDGNTNANEVASQAENLARHDTKR